VEFRSASSEEEALDWLAQLGDESCVLAGGTDAMMQLARAEIAPAVLVHIERLRSLAIASTSEQPRHGPVDRFGALTTHLELARSSDVRRRLPALAEAASTVGGWQTQSVGTLAGNICNSSPAADTAPPLLVGDAVVELRSANGSRRVALCDFFLGRRRVDRRPDELVTAIEVTPLADDESETYLKVGRRGAMVVAVVGLAVRLAFDGTGKITRARVAVCSVAPTPVRVPEAERVLAQGDNSPSALHEAGETLVRAVAPIDDSRATAAYRQGVLAGLLGRAVAQCAPRASS
jgi:aerobic carbon-monoxide dehydrogenase medium subunit